MPTESGNKTPLQIAEERIEKARKDGAAELDLSGLRLTALPKSLGDLTSLKLSVPAWERCAWDFQRGSRPEFRRGLSFFSCAVAGQAQ